MRARLINGRWMRRLAIALVLAVSATLLTGCTRWIALDSDRYEPSFSRDLSTYVGRSVYLKDIVSVDPEAYHEDFSDAEKTTWYWSSAYYGTIETYLWYVLAKALETAGMKVSETGDPDRSAPQLGFAIVSLSEATYRFRVELARYGRVLLVKEYQASLSVLAGPERTDQALERRIDRMVDELIQNVLTDPQFKKAFLEEPGKAEPVR